IHTNDHRVVAIPAVNGDGADVERALQADGLVVVRASDGEGADVGHRGGVVDAAVGRAVRVIDDELEVGAIAAGGNDDVFGQAVAAQGLLVHVQHEVVAAGEVLGDPGDERGDAGFYRIFTESAIQRPVDVWGRTPPASVGGNTGDLVAKWKRE